jgi:branched-chain amino acid transport system permease protein
LNERVRSEARLLPLLGLAVVAFGLAAHANASLVQAGTYAALYAVAAIGLSLLLGNVAQISLGQAGFFGVGAYAAAYVATNVTYPAGTPGWAAFVLGTLLGTALAAGLGLVLGFIALRFRGHYLAMATLAFGLIAVGVFRASPALGGANGMTNIPFAQFGSLALSGGAAFWYAWLMAGLCALLAFNLLRGRSGRAFAAIRSDELAAETCGVPTRRYKILAFAFAGGLAGFAGTFYASYLGSVDPSAVGVDLSIDILLMVVLGGSGSIAGAVLGATVIGIGNVYGHDLQNWRPVIYGVLVVAIVIAFPHGLAGIFTRPRRHSAESKPGSVPAAGTLDSPEPALSSPGERSTTPREEAPRAPASVPWLEVANVTKRFGGLTAVDDVSFSLSNGSLTALIGPNGAGKTTLFNAICGVGRVDCGSVRVAGCDVTAWQPHRIAALGVGRSFQNARLFADLSVLENVALGTFWRERASFASDLLGLGASRRSGREALQRARLVLAELDLERLAAVPASELAFGERRRVELARAVAAAPGLLLVDEPAAGLNANERAHLRDDLRALRARGMTLLLIEHDMRLVMDVSNRVLVLRFGKLIAAGTPAEVRADPAVISAYLGTPA